MDEIASHVQQSITVPNELRSCLSFSLSLFPSFPLSPCPASLFLKVSVFLSINVNTLFVPHLPQNVGFAGSDEDMLAQRPVSHLRLASTGTQAMCDLSFECTNPARTLASSEQTQARAEPRGPLSPPHQVFSPFARPALRALKVLEQAHLHALAFPPSGHHQCRRLRTLAVVDHHKRAGLLAQ